MKRRRNQQPNDDDDDNNSYEYQSLGEKSIGSNDIYYMNINPKGNKCICKAQIYFLNRR